MINSETHLTFPFEEIIPPPSGAQIIFNRFMQEMRGTQRIDEPHFFHDGSHLRCKCQYWDGTNGLENSSLPTMQRLCTLADKITDGKIPGVSGMNVSRFWIDELDDDYNAVLDLTFCS